MIKKLLPFTLCMLPGLLMAYTISIEGIVYNNQDQSQPGAKILVKSVATDPLKVDTFLIADDLGRFTFKLQIPDHVEKGTLIFWVNNCGQSSAKRIVYHPNTKSQHLRLKDCQPGKDDCEVVITEKQLNDQSLQLIAETKGFGPYSYSWNTGDTTAAIIVTKTGQYFVVVQDAEGCEAKANFHFNSDQKCRTELKVKPSGDSVYVYKLLARSKGTSPFTYLWSTGDTTSEILVKDPGQYCVTVVDADGCESSDCKLLRDPVCQVDIQAIRSNAQTGLNHLQLIARSKGIAPFKYSWSNGDTTKVIRISDPGIYCVEVVDALGCLAQDCIEVDPAMDCKTNISVLPASANALMRVRLMAQNRGQAPFNYLWSTGDTTKSISVKELMLYCVKVVDANGCISEDCIDLSILATQCEVDIHRSAGGNLIAQPRGFPPFKFVWNTGDTTRFIQTDSAGEYCVSVTNAFGCVAQSCISLMSSDSTHCRVKIQRKARKEEGTVELIANVHPKDQYKFAWSTGDTSQTIIVSEAGDYCVEVFGEFCQLDDCVTVNMDHKPSFMDAATDLYPSYSNENRSIRLQAFPNPVLSQIQLFWDQMEKSGPFEVLVRHISGKSVLIKQLKEGAEMNDLSIDLSSLEPGIYVIQVRGNGYSEQVKILKSH